MQVYLSVGGKRYGPFSIEKLNEGIAKGKVNVHEAQAWWDGCSHWQPVGRVPGVQMPVGATGASPPPPLPAASLVADPDFAPTAAPPTAPSPASPVVESETARDVQVLIPYRNKPALFAYYLAIVGLLPVIGFPCAAVAVILGIKGLRKRAANPQVRGAVHAWIGVGLGGLVTLGYLLLVALIVLSL